MTSVQKLMKIDKDLKLEGAELRNFVERQQAQEREERKLEREQRCKDNEKELTLAEMRMKDYESQLALAEMRYKEALAKGAFADSEESKPSNIPPPKYDDKKTPAVEKYLENFEAAMSQNETPKRRWAVQVRAAVMDSLLEPVVELCNNYDEMKQEILAIHGKTPEQM